VLWILIGWSARSAESSSRPILAWSIRSDREMLKSDPFAGVQNRPLTTQQFFPIARVAMNGAAHSPRVAMAPNSTPLPIFTRQATRRACHFCQYLIRRSTLTMGPPKIRPRTNSEAQPPELGHFSLSAPGVPTPAQCLLKPKSRKTAVASEIVFWDGARFHVSAPITSQASRCAAGFSLLLLLPVPKTR
jgi:hypothetical protein